jgi:hypothetical protein
MPAPSLLGAGIVFSRVGGLCDGIVTIDDSFGDGIVTKGGGAQERSLL